MFQKRKIDLLYRLICLLTFTIVIIFIRSFITLALLVLIFYVFTKNDGRFLSVFLYIVTFLAFVVSYYANNFDLLKFVVILDFIYYFLDIPTLEEMIDDMYTPKEKNEEVKEKPVKSSLINNDSYYVRFSGVPKKKKSKKGNFAITVYLTLHLVLLFVAIMVG